MIGRTRSRSPGLPGRGLREGRGKRYWITGSALRDGALLAERGADGGARLDCRSWPPRWARETTSRSPNCTPALRRTIPISAFVEAESCVQFGSARRGFDGTCVRAPRVGHAGNTGGRILRAGARAGRRSIRNEREPPGAGTTALYARGVSTERL